MWNSTSTGTRITDSLAQSFTTRQHFSFFIMNRETALGMLRVGNTGNEILQILDVIESDTQSDNQGDAVSYITGESVTF